MNFSYIVFIFHYLYLSIYYNVIFSNLILFNKYDNELITFIIQEKIATTEERMKVVHEIHVIISHCLFIDDINKDNEIKCVLYSL